MVVNDDNCKLYRVNYIYIYRCINMSIIIKKIWQSAFIIFYLTSLSEPTLTINPSGSAAEMGSLNCDIQTSLYVIGRTSKSFLLLTMLIMDWFA